VQGLRRTFEKCITVKHEHSWKICSQRMVQVVCFDLIFPVFYSYFANAHWRNGKFFFLSGFEEIAKVDLFKVTPVHTLACSDFLFFCHLTDCFFFKTEGGIFGYALLFIFLVSMFTNYLCTWFCNIFAVLGFGKKWKWSSKLFEYQ